MSEEIEATNIMAGNGGVTRNVQIAHVDANSIFV